MSNRQPKSDSSDRERLLGQGKTEIRTVASNDTAKMEATLSDDSFEMALMTLLANMEYLRFRMETASEKRQPGKALVSCEQILEHLIRFADDHMIQDSSLAIQEATLEVARFYSTISPVREQFQGSILRKIFGFREPGSSKKKSEDRQEQFTRCLESVSDAVTQYFIAFTERFPNSKAGRAWVETASGFLADLRRVIRDTKI